MPVALVQSAYGAGVGTTWTATFGSGTTNGNDVVVWVTGFSSSGATISATTPTLGGSSVSGAVQLFSVQSSTGAGNTVWCAAWLLPSVPGGQTAVATTVTGSGTFSDAVGIYASEFSGVPGTSVTASTNSGTSGTTLDPGALSAPAGSLVVACGLAFGQAVTPPGSPWAQVHNTGTEFGAPGWQSPASTGSLDYVCTAASSEWAAGIAVITSAPAVVVQSAASSAGSLSATFGSPVTAGNSVVVAAALETTTAGAYLATSSPLLGGSPVTGATLLQRCQSPDSTSVHLSWWLLPNVAGGETTVSVSSSASSGSPTSVGLLAWEVASSAVGTAPVLDRRAASVGTASAATSVATIPTTASSGVALGAATATSALTPPSSPWTATSVSGTLLTGGWQAVATGATPSIAAGTASADWAAGAVVIASSVPSAPTWRDIAPASPSTTGQVTTWSSVATRINGTTTQTIRVLQPGSPAAGVPHNFLITLPAAAGEDDTTSGDGFDTVNSLTVNGVAACNAYNITVIEASYSTAPCHADNVVDPTVQYETFLLQVINWARATYGTGGEKFGVLGYSKSGIGAQTLAFRNPGAIWWAGGWDFPAQITAMQSDGTGTDPNGNISPSTGNMLANYGTPYNYLQNYCLNSANLAGWASPFTTAKRIWVGGYADFQADVAWYKGTALPGAAILANTAWSQSQTHAWHPEFVAAALAFMFGGTTPGLIMAAII